jgi:hypothetical protein
MTVAIVSILLMEKISADRIKILAETPAITMGKKLALEISKNVSGSVSTFHDNAGKYIYSILYYNIRECINNIEKNKCVKEIARKVDKVLSGVI